MSEIHIKAFRAVDDLQTCMRFVEGHTRVLKIFGITKITSARKEWMSNPFVYVIIAETAAGELVGGIRVQVAGGNMQLPVEEAVGEMDASIHDLVLDHARDGAGELCGLWNAREVAGMGVSVFLTRAGVALLAQLKLSAIFGICADLTLPMFKNVGYEIETSVGTEGRFYYPKEDLIANVIVIKDTNLLQHANKTDRERILSLRQDWNQQAFEAGSKGIVSVSYNLELAIKKQAVLK